LNDQRKLKPKGVRTKKNKEEETKKIKGGGKKGNRVRGEVGQKERRSRNGGGDQLTPSRKKKEGRTTVTKKGEGQKGLYRMTWEKSR